MSTETSVPPPRAEGLDAPDAALLDTLLREAPIGFAFFDTSLRFQRINQTLADLHGVTPAAHISHRPAEVWQPEIAEPVENVLHEVLTTDRALLDADQRVAPADDDGDGRHWAFSSFPAHNAEGKISGIALIAVDVNDRQLAEEEVRRSEERYRSLVQASSGLVWVAKPSGLIYEDSQEWRAITGQTLDEYLGDGWLSALHEDDREKTEAAWHKAVTERSVFQMTFRVRTRGGGYRTMESRAVPIVRHGETVEWVGTHTDISSQREADEMRHRLTEQLSAAALRTARLQQATSMLAEALTVEQVVQVIMEVGRSAIGADRSEVALLDGDRRELRLVNPGESGTAARGDLVPLDKPSVLSIAVRERKPFLAETPDMLRIQLRTPETDAFIDETDERSWVGLPLLAAGNTIGALRFAFTRQRQITEEEKVFLEALAGQCALAVERATLFEREHTTAEVLQRSLLPERLPKVPGIALHAKYLPGTKNVQVGGDWYDGIPLADGRFGVVVGDVVGKGLTAAAGMSRVRNGLRALALSDPRPKAVLDGLDRLFSVTEADEQVTTLAYLVIDPVTGNGVLGNAGHLPPLLVGPDTEPKLVYTEPGTPLGWPTPRSQHPFTVPPGSTAVLYSDGLVENHRRKLSDGLDDLVAAAAEAPADVIASPEKILEYLVENMLAGYEQDDDVTVLAIRVVPQDP